MDPELRQYLEQMEKRLDARIEDTEKRLDARIERVETNLLTAFHKWAQTHEVRSRGVLSTMTDYSERLTIIEDRLSAVERKIDLRQ